MAQKKKIYKKGGKHFILPEKEIKQLAKQGKHSDPLEHSEAEKKERRGTEITNIAQKSVDIERAKENILISEEKEKRETKLGDPLLEEPKQEKETMTESGLEGRPEGEIITPEKNFVFKMIDEYRDDPKLFFQDLGLAVGVTIIPQTIAQIPAATTIVVTTIRQMVTHTPDLAKQATITVSGKTFNIAQISGMAANNAKNFGLKVSYLTKLVSTAKNPMVLLGIIGSVTYTSLFWAPNEKGDALVTLAITQAQAAKNKQWDQVYEINEMIQEVNNITASVPIVGFLKAEWAKFAAAAKASEVYKEQADKATGKDGA